MNLILSKINNRNKIDSKVNYYFLNWWTQDFNLRRITWGVTLYRKLFNIKRISAPNFRPDDEFTIQDWGFRISTSVILCRTISSLWWKFCVSVKSASWLFQYKNLITTYMTNSLEGEESKKDHVLEIGLDVCLVLARATVPRICHFVSLS